MLKKQTKKEMKTKGEAEKIKIRYENKKKCINISSGSQMILSTAQVIQATASIIKRVRSAGSVRLYWKSEIVPTFGDWFSLSDGFS